MKMNTFRLMLWSSPVVGLILGGFVASIAAFALCCFLVTVHGNVVCCFVCCFVLVVRCSCVQSTDCVYNNVQPYADFM